MEDTKKIGPESFPLISRLIAKSRHPLLFLRRCQGIVRLKSTCGAKKIERAALAINQLGIDFPRLRAGPTKRKSVSSGPDELVL